MHTRTPSSPADPDRAIALIAREGVIDSVDLDAGKVVVKLGDGLTPPIDWMGCFGDTTIWIPPTRGAQVSVITPEGDVERAYVIGGLPSSQMAHLFLGLKTAIRFKDNSVVSYDPEANELNCDLVGGFRITAPNGLHIDADVHITGDVQVDQTLTATTDVVGGGKRLKTHRHLGVTPGGGTSGAPE